MDHDARLQSRRPGRRKCEMWTEKERSSFPASMVSSTMHPNSSSKPVPTEENHVPQLYLHSWTGANILGYHRSQNHTPFRRTRPKILPASLLTRAPKPAREVLRQILQPHHIVRQHTHIDVLTLNHHSAVRHPGSSARLELRERIIQ